MNMTEKYYCIITFVDTTLNACGTKNNAVCYDEEKFEHSQNVKVVFNREHKKHYAKLLEYCSKNELIVESTNPATYATVIRVEE